jgi:hypothetical protein
MIKLLLSLALSLLLQTTLASADAKIKWRVNNPFRLFVNPADTAAHRDAYAAYEKWLQTAPQDEKDRFAAEGKGPIYFAEISYFAARHAKSKPKEPYRGWAETVVGRGRNGTCFDQEKQQYSACEKGGAQAKDFRGGSYMNPKAHEIEVWIEGDADLAGDCIWSRAEGKEAASTDLPPSLPCISHKRLDVTFGQTSTISVRRANAPPDTFIVKNESVEVTDVLIVGLGDSFASGDGNPDSPVRFSSTSFNNYQVYETTYPKDAWGWCRALAVRGTWNISPSSCDTGAIATRYRLAGYPARVASGSNYIDDSPFDTNVKHFLSAEFRAKSSEWLSKACHRSLYSYQTRVALQLALEDDHRAVTFLGYACTGAEIVEGLLLKEKFNLEREDNLARRLNVSQLAAVSKTYARAIAPPSSMLA